MQYKFIDAPQRNAKDLSNIGKKNLEQYFPKPKDYSYSKSKATNKESN